MVEVVGSFISGLSPMVQLIDSDNFNAVRSL